MNNIEWKIIEGYDGRYMINNEGDIYSNISNIILKQSIGKRNGYCYITLHKSDGTSKGHRVHRLVAQAFIPNPNNLPEVNHEDFNKQNNNVANLVWCDRFYQNQPAATKPDRKWQRHRLGKVGKQNPASKAVMALTLKGALVGVFESGILAAKATNSNQAKISSCCLGKRKTHNKLIFKFI